MHELDDGEDCLDWVLAQPWCDGRIGTYGTAYSASTALYLSASGRDEVKALAVLGTGADIHDGWVYTSGAFELGWNVYWAYMTAAETIKRLDVDEETRKELQREYERAIIEAPAVAARLPISDHPLLDRVGETQYREWLEHPDYDDYWASFDVLALTERLRAPMLSIDRVARQLPQVALRPLPRARRQAPHRLVVGPWEHTSYVSPFSTSRAGAVEFGPRRGLGRRALDAAPARLVRPLDHGRGRPARPAACATGSSARTSGARRTPGRRPHAEERWYLRSRRRRQQPPTATASSAPRPPTARSRRTRIVYDPLDPVAHGRRQDADAVDHDGRDRGPGRGRGAPGRALLHDARS